MDSLQKYPESVHEISVLLLKAQEGSFEDEIISVDSSSQIMRSVETKPLLNHDTSMNCNRKSDLNSSKESTKYGTLNSNQNSTIQPNITSNNMIESELKNNTSQCISISHGMQTNDNKLNLVPTEYVHTNIENIERRNNINIANNQAKSMPGIELYEKLNGNDMESVRPFIENNKNKFQIEESTTITDKETCKLPNNNDPCLYQQTYHTDLHTHEPVLIQRNDTDIKNASQHFTETSCDKGTLLQSSSSACFPPSKTVTSQNMSSTCAQSRILFKKSHTCGSLFAKCSCDDNDSSTGNSRKNSLHQEQFRDVVHYANSVGNNTTSVNNVTDYKHAVNNDQKKINDNSKRSNSLDSRSNIKIRDTPVNSSSLEHKFRIQKFDELQKAQAKCAKSSDDERGFQKLNKNSTEKIHTDLREEKFTQESCQKSHNRKRSQENRHININYPTEALENIQSEIICENIPPFPTLGNIYSNICYDHPELCLKHPEIPYPIPPKILQNKINRSDDCVHQKIFKVQNFPRKISNETKDKQTVEPELSNKEHRQVSDTKCPVSLTQVFQTRDYIPDFPDQTIAKHLDFIRNNNSAYRYPVYSADPAEEFLKESGIIGPMGNGVSSTIRKNSKVNQEVIRKNSKILADNVKRHSSGIPDDYDYLKTVVPHLKKELGEWEQKAGNLEADVLQLRRELQSKESEVIKLRREIHKLKSVLQQTTSSNHDGDLLATLQERHGMANRASKLYTSATINIIGNDKSEKGKKQGVSAESSDCSNQQASDIQITRYDKDFRSKQLIKDAIMDNDFLKNLDSSQVREIVDSMYQREYPAGSYVIREGEAGAHLFVSAEGEFEVIKDNIVLGRMGPGKAFGELAILYNCTRTASIRVDADSKVWVLDRKVFQQIMMRTGLQRLQDNINFLRSVPLLRNLSNEVLAKIADVLEVEFYPADAYIIRQGASGDTFFIISSGCVKVTQRIGVGCTEQNIRTLSRGDYFGEQALLKEDCRTASVVALHPGVECLTLDRDSFIQLIGDLSELQEKDYGDEQRALSRPNSAVNVTDNAQELDHIKLDDLDVIATLGVGGFGRVELVQYAYDRTQTFALKCLKKQHIVDTQQQEHVFSEKNIMMSCRSPFICRLYKTFRDSKYVYMLLEACLGGEVWTILRDRGCFDDHTTRFITACVVEAFAYLHSKGIIYRDLKPENLLLDSRGYVKLVDFGFSKRLGYSSKTWTFCGTPEYVAPETILNKGHDRAVDYWALGILMHELLTGTPPFTAADPMKTYNIILKGIDMIVFPRYVTRAAQSLIKRLCRDAPSERLGYQRGGIQDIKKHKWFQGFDWDGLHNRAMTAPLMQPVRGPHDTSNFDCYAKDTDIPPDELSNWDLEF